MAFKKDWMKPGGQHRGARKHQTAGERKNVSLVGLKESYGMNGTNVFSEGPGTDVERGICHLKYEDQPPRSG